MISRYYQCRPSDIVGELDNYTAFCFDEACAYIRMKIEEGETPIYKDQVERHYSSFSEMYKKVGG